MQLAASKALQELSWESIEFLFRPRTMLELLLRIDFDGMVQKIHDWCGDDSPSAMPHRFRSPYVAEMMHIIEIEKFYQTLKKLVQK